MMGRINKKVRELADLLGIPFEGDGDVEIYGYSGIQDSKKGTITFLSDKKFEKFLDKTRASAIILQKGKEYPSIKIPKLYSEYPYFTFVKIIELFKPRRHPLPGIHKTAIIEESVHFGNNVSIGAHVFIGEKTSIDDGSIIYPSAFIGRNCKIGKNSIIYPNVSILDETEVGSKVIIHSGTVVGSDGYGYINISGIHEKIPQTGKVVIEDDVEIGSNVSIDRATLDETRICKGTKIDNLVQIAHNVKIGENTLIVSQVGIAGSSEIGKNVILAGQVGVIGHIKIGDNSIIGSQSGIGKSLPPNSRCSGSPAIDHKSWLKSIVTFPKIPDMLKKLNELEERINKLDFEG
ncbi:UDP-3-O-(3-hydroxymyristoyl)glucosamine N-acyltransferase [bacterium]|nr:UDP-3-O-(3-hydroxymyristoyl)glucosamine N-acyltransferase [bacterium]